MFCVTISDLAAKSSFGFVVILMNRHNQLKLEAETVDTWYWNASFLLLIFPNINQKHQYFLLEQILTAVAFFIILVLKFLEHFVSLFQGFKISLKILGQASRPIFIIVTALPSTQQYSFYITLIFLLELKHTTIFFCLFVLSFFSLFASSLWVELSLSL